MIAIFLVITIMFVIAFFLESGKVGKGVRKWRFYEDVYSTVNNGRIPKRDIVGWHRRYNPFTGGLFDIVWKLALAYIVLQLLF